MREAYLALSVSYTNEGNLKSAHEVLEKWVDLFDPNQNKGQDTDAGRFGSSGEDEEVGMTRNQRHEVLTRELMRMARMRPQGDVDADVQVALGVLFNASEVGRRISSFPLSSSRQQIVIFTVMRLGIRQSLRLFSYRPPSARRRLDALQPDGRDAR